MSSAGGQEPIWRHDGQELFYLSPEGKMMAVAVTTGPSFKAGSPEPLAASASLSLRRDSEDLWLKHAEAAEYLHVSKSTLYQYACQQKIECRKLAGRLEYRRSTLDQFKDRQIRPAHRSFSQRSIIPTALGSGK